MHCSCESEDMKKLDMTNYVETPLPNVPRIGWDDPNEQEYMCANCGGLVGVTGRIYGLVANWCRCGNPSKAKTMAGSNDLADIKKLLKEILEKLK
jgi:hypothetical protein